jgi:repressor LexA
MMEMTQKQIRTLEFIRREIETKNRAPTFSEIAEFLGSSSKSSAQNMIRALTERGLINTSPWSVARGIELSKAGAAFGRRPVFDTDAEQWAIPCLGAVPAGNPLEAIGEQVGVLSIAPALLKRPRPRQDQLFAVRAVGDSMLGAGILNNDWLVVRCQQTATVGDIVVARVDGDATVKRFAKDANGRPYLKAENPAYRSIDKEFEIVGRVVTLSRVL